MTAEEYLAQSKYAPYEGTMTVLEMGDNCSFIKDNHINCVGRIKVDNLFYVHIKVDLDGRIIEKLPDCIFYQIHKPNAIYRMWKRLDSFFMNLIIFAEFGNQDRELVELRINVNLIYQIPIAKEDRLQWADWIKELYWNRKAILNEWYIKYVLPF